MARLVTGVFAGAVALVAALTGCGAYPHDRTVRDAARSFSAAITERDGRAACAALTPKAAESLQSGGESCVEAITRLDLSGGSVLQVRVWGDFAQVRLNSDTLFLADSPAGWKVSAADCEPRPGQPYDCEVEA